MQLKLMFQEHCVQSSSKVVSSQCSPWYIPPWIRHRREGFYSLVTGGEWIVTRKLYLSYSLNSQVKRSRGSQRRLDFCGWLYSTFSVKSNWIVNHLILNFVAVHSFSAVDHWANRFVPLFPARGLNTSHFVPKTSLAQHQNDLALSNWK